MQWNRVAPVSTPVQYRWFAFEIASSSRRTVVAPVSTGAVEKAWRTLTFHPASFLSSAGRGRRRGGWRERTLATPHAMVTQVRAHCAIRVFNQVLRSIAAGPGWGPAPTLRSLGAPPGEVASGDEKRWNLCSSQEETGGAEVRTRPFRSSLFLHLQESTGLTRILI